MHILKYSTILIILAIVLSLAGQLVNVSQATSPTLVALLNYSVLGGITVTNIGSTTTNGDVGVSPGSSITGFPPGIAGGGKHSNDGNAIAAQAEALTVFGVLNQPCDHTYGAQDLTLISPLVPGVYCSTSIFSLTGNLTLTGSGVWIFKTVSMLITSPGSSVTGGDPCNVWWRIGSSTTLDTNTSFIGNIIALTDIDMNVNATLNGRAIAQTGAVTLYSTTITGPVCRPTLTTTASGPATVSDNITDTAHLVGTSGKGVGGTLTFNVYAPGDTSCVTPIAVGTGVAVSTPGDYTSANYATTTVGTSRWRAFYSGDANNSAVSTACNDPNEMSTVNPKPAALLISGNAGVGGATLSYTDGSAKMATSAVDGSYSVNVSYNWSGTVTPSKPGYTFTPINRSYTNVVTSQNDQNYTAFDHIYLPLVIR
jgi:hypothetical protein